MYDDDCAGNDIVRTHPLDCKALIPAHKRSYSFTDLVPIFGFKACSKFRLQWESLYKDVNKETTRNEYLIFKRMLRDVGLSHGSGEPVFKALSSGRLPNQAQFQRYIEGLRNRILDPEDSSFTDAGQRSVVKYLEVLRNALARFAASNLLPRVELSLQGMYGDDDEVRSPCFAAIAIEAGRLKLDGDDDQDNALRFHVTNRNLLAALRSSLIDIFKAGKALVEEGRRLVNAPSIPPLAKIVRAMRVRAGLWGARSRAKRGLASLLDGPADYVKGIAIRAFKALFNRAKLEISRNSLKRLLQEAGGVELISKLAEPCNDTLMAATTVIQIDTGWESSTVLNMDVDPFVGTVRKNTVTVRAIVSRKGRARGKLRNAALVEMTDEDIKPDKDVGIAVKERGEMTGYQVILAYKDMVADIRSEFPPAQAKKLWLSRGARSMNAVIYGAFRKFLERSVEHPVFGGLPLTRRSIKRTKYNIDAHSTIGNIGLARAHGDHASDKLAFAYLSAPAVRAIFKHKIREYIEQLDAVIYSSVDELAAKLGMPEDVLNRRRVLGIQNGLSELLLKQSKQAPMPTEDFVSTARTLKPDNDGLRSLVVAGFAIDARWEEMSAKNPGRFLRTWVPWMALIQAMVQRLKKTRHRVKFRQTLEQVRSEIAAGTLFLPILW
ncbi:hypothetical protein ELG72_09660 [Rhizobium leguminosarum]|uniref:hypothetical protein n=1 Tax=Rhizobium leguminosarum TaxID=384 RepID=UPI0010320C05|nr:hypothetical protein [Rhizobium leguminosarum]TBG63296.1 hypothetical protein ELG72_09660 [Rhizobium leguminosarum]